MLTPRRYRTSWILLSTLLLTHSACGKKNDPELVIMEDVSVSPKIDILLGQGHSEAMMSSNDALAAQIPQTLADLSSTGGDRWNLHFTSVGLNTSSVNGNREVPITQIAASQPDSVDAKYFKKPLEYSAFITSKSISPRNDDKTKGLESIYAALTAKTDNTGFSRPDALLVVWAATAQEDTSGTDVCVTSNNQSIPCDSTDAEKDKNLASLNSYKIQLPALKANKASFIFHAFVAGTNGECNDGAVTAGNRYTEMANLTGGLAVNLCAVSAEQFLGAMKSTLHDLRTAMETEYLFLDEEAEEKSIEVFKGAQKIERGTNNGWTYEGKVKDVYQISAPIALNAGSGFAIRLHGSAKLKGTESAKIVFQTPEQFKKKPRELK